MYSEKVPFLTKREKNFRENWADELPGVRHAVPLDEEGNIDESTPKLPKVMFCQTRKAYLIMFSIYLYYYEITCLY
jgi:hypothetical protein